MFHSTLPPFASAPSALHIEGPQIVYLETPMPEFLIPDFTVFAAFDHFKVNRLTREHVIIMYVVAREYERVGARPEITGICCEKAYERGTSHNEDRAIDFRTSNLDNPDLVINRINHRLKGIDPLFYTMWYDPDHHNDHLHVGYLNADRKSPYEVGR